MSSDAEAERAALKVPASHTNSGTIKMTHTSHERPFVHVVMCVYLCLKELRVLCVSLSKCSEPVLTKRTGVCVHRKGLNEECVYMYVFVCVSL